MRPLNDTDVADAIRMLAGYLNRRVEAFALAIYAKELLDLHISTEHFADAMAQWMRTHGATAFLPAPVELAAFVREYLHERAKERRDPYVFEKAARAANTAHGKEAIVMIQKRLGGKLNRGAYLAWMREMETKLPGVGWKQAADALERLHDADRARQQQLPEAGRLAIEAKMVVGGLLEGGKRA